MCVEGYRVGGDEEKEMWEDLCKQILGRAGELILDAK